MHLHRKETKMKINSFEDVDKALLEIGKAESIRTRKEAMMNSQIQKIREKFEEETLNERNIITALESDIEDFCSHNKKEFEKDKRTIELVHGSVGYRTNPPKVLQLSNKFKLVTTMELIKKLLNPVKYLRTKTELNKEAILGDYIDKKKATELKPYELKEKLTDEKLATVGLRIEQEETFNYEIKWDELNSSNAS